MTKSKSDLINAIAEQKASATLPFASVLKNGTSWMLNSEIYHPFPDSKNFVQSISKLMKIQFLMYKTP